MYGVCIPEFEVAKRGDRGYNMGTTVLIMRCTNAETRGFDQDQGKRNGQKNG